MIVLKRGDNGIGIRATLSNENGPVDLTDASVLFLFSNFEINAQIHDAENGVVNVFLEKMHTEKTGEFYAEFEVQFSDGRVETFPNNDYLRLKIIKDLGGVS